MNKWFHIILFFCLTLSFSLSLTTPSDANENAQDLWRDYSAGDKVYAEVVEAPDAIYHETVTDIGVVRWLRLENTLLFEQAINVSARYQYLNVEHVLRVKIINDQWGQIEPDNGDIPYVTDTESLPAIFVELKFLKPLGDNAFEPFSVYSDTQPEDKLIVVIRDSKPKIVLFEGYRPVLHAPVVLGPSNPGDYRVYMTRAADDMSGIPAVPYSNYFSGGFSIHGAPWWNWRELSQGYYGSHGCVNLPDREWYQLLLDNEMVSVAQWIYRWNSTNIDYAESDPTVEEVQLNFRDEGWYEATGSVRVLIVENIESVVNHPVPTRLGKGATDGAISDWRPLIDAYYGIQDHWMIMHEHNAGEFVRQQMPKNQSIAQVEGTTDSDTWVMLQCTDTSTYDQLAYPGSSRTIGDVCHHLIVERQNSICTPERVDVAFFGEKVLCNADRLNYLPLDLRGGLIEHERVHLEQFGGYFKDLHLQGIAIDDPTPLGPTEFQASSIGLTELMAQRMVSQFGLGGDYSFVLVRPDGSGGRRAVNWRASADVAWNFLREECGDRDLIDTELENVIEEALLGDNDAYQYLETVCTLPPHQLIPDRWRAY